MKPKLDPVTPAVTTPVSYLVTWKTPDGVLRRNQVWAPSRDQAIWRLALLMQAAHPSQTEFVSCESEDAR